MKEKFKPLFETYTFNNGVTAKNRLAIAPLTHWSADKDDGNILAKCLLYHVKLRLSDDILHISSIINKLCKYTNDFFYRR